MVWYVFAFLGAFAASLYYILSKKFVKEVAIALLGGLSFFVAGAIMLLLSYINGLPQIKEGLLEATLVTGIANGIGTVLLYSALRENELSISMPMLSYSVLPLLVSSFIVLGEIPSLPALLGIIMIFGGTYFMELKVASKFLDPYRELFSNRGVQMMVAVALLYGMAATYDKLVVLKSDFLFGTSLTLLMIGAVLLFFALIKKELIIEEIKKHSGKFFLCGIAIVLISIAMNISYLNAPVAYAISIKRLSVLFTVAYGAIVLGEHNKVNRLVAAVVMVAGAILIITS